VSKVNARTEIAPLTGLRGLAALLVVITHYAVWMRVTPADMTPGFVQVWFGVSSIGMAMFFTLSGFVIALSYSHWNWAERPGFCLVRLFFYRLARLYPAFLLFAVLVVLRSPRLRDGASDPPLAEYLLEHLLLWQSWLLVKFDGLLSPSSAFHVSWSLSTECGLYLMFGLGAVLAAALPSFRSKGAVLGMAFFAAMTFLLVVLWDYRSSLMPEGWNDQEWRGWLLQFSPLGVSINFAFGVAAYRLWRAKLLGTAAQTLASNLGVLGLVAIYVGLVTTQLRSPYAVELMSGASTALIMLGSSATSRANVVLASRPLVYVGTVSYSLYLFHFWIVSPFAGTLDRFDGRAALFYLVNVLTALFMAIMLATGTYQLVEVPGRRLIRRFADRFLGVEAVGEREPAPTLLRS
jgi:peptidoglycan/LPS O-acetylase OafA/YrhL